MSKMSNILIDKRWYAEDSTIPNDVVFTADEFLSFKRDINDIIEMYGQISVGDLIDLVIGRTGVNLKPRYIAYKYYWNDSRDFHYERVNHGEPKPTDTWRLIANDPIYE